MSTITLKANVTQEKEIELSVPCFMRTKDEKQYIALLDEKTVVTIFRTDDYTSISNADLGYAEKTKLIEAFQKWHSCTESEFFDAYHDTVESISLHPVLAI